MIILRPATLADQRRIRAIVRLMRINPLSLKWQKFVVAVDEATGQIVGTGQVKGHMDGSRELASIAVLPAYQRQGIATRIVTHLLERHPGALFLICRSPLRTFYEPFGFRVVGEAEMSPYFRRLKRVKRVVDRLAREGIDLLVMKRP